MHVFDGKVQIEPGTAARTVSSVPPTPIQLGSGTVAILAESKGGLTAADGVIYKYASDRAGVLKNILMGATSATGTRNGQRMVGFCFAPSGQFPGASEILFIRTQAATRATGTITNNANDFVMVSYDKGAYLSDVTNGLKWKIIAGIVDSNKRILQLQLNGQLIWQSPETTNTYLDMYNAIVNDPTVYGKIIYSVTQANPTETFAAAGFTVFAGGTETAMTGTDVDTALDLIRTREVDIVFVGSETNTNHAKAVAHCITDAETPRISIFGGVVGETKAQATARAVAINSHKGILCYPGIIVGKEDGSGSETLSPMYTASMVAGLIAGLAPQTPATGKTLAVLGFEINSTDGELVKSERQELITYGVTFCRYKQGVGYCVNKAVTTLQNNTQMINSPGGESREVSIERIKNQLNKELQIGSESLFPGGTVGTVSEADVTNYVKGYLAKRTVSPTQDNLILGYTSVTAQLIDDAWFVEYGFYPNTPINHVFFTGVILKNGA